MPFRIIKNNDGYFVENIQTHKKYSKHPLEKKKAEKQFNILNKYLETLEGSGLNKKQIKQIKRKPLSDADIRAYLPDAKIISTSELNNIKDIDELLPKDKDVIFLLYQSKPNYGHWVLLSKYNNTIEYNDSYGGKIDGPLKWNSKKVNNILENEPYITDLLTKAQDKYKIIYSIKDLQKDSPDVADCGRFAIMRALTILNDNQTLKDYIKMMNEMKKITGFDYDDIVSGIINI
jgi:hypothetical protein